MTSNIQQFKQQTFSLIKEQATRLKTNAKELEIKQEQIRLLKETIEALQEEKDQHERGKNSFKAKLDLVMKQVANYNQTVVHKLHNENQLLRSNLQQLGSKLEQSLQTVKRLTKQLQISEEKLQRIRSQQIRLKQQSKEGEKQIVKLKAENSKLKQLNSQNEKRVNRLQSVNEQIENKCKSFEKQVDSLVSKCQQTANSYQKKLRTLRENLVKKEQIIKCQQQLERQSRKGEQSKKQIERLSRQKNQNLLAIKTLKQKQIGIYMKHQMQQGLIQADLRNLKQSFTLCKKISEFQSKHSDIFYSLFEVYQSCHLTRQEQDKKIQILQDRINQTEKIIKQKTLDLNQAKTEYDIISSKVKQETGMIESSYEGKILQLSIKIKKQQKALRQLGIKDREFDHLNEEYEKLASQHFSMKETLENTINQYKKENEKLANQVQQLVVLCDENINTKNSLNSLKHTISNLLCIVYFLHLNLIRGRQARRKLYLPFIQFYYKTRFSLVEKKKKKKNLSRLKSCVVVVIAINRMQKCARQVGNLSGLARYVDKALKMKGKIEDLSEYLQGLIQKAIKNEKNIHELFKETRTIYKWSCLHNFLKVNIPINWYSSIAHSQQE